MIKEKFDVVGMTCSSCAMSVEKAVRKMNGVSSVNVNLLSNNMVVEYDDSLVNSSTIISTVSSAGYNAMLTSSSTAPPTKDEVSHVQSEIEEMKQRVIVSLVFMVLLLYVAMGPMVGLPLPSFLVGVKNAATMALVQFFLTLPVVYVNRQYYQTGFKTLWHRSPNMDSLIAIGSGAAIVYGIYALFKITYGLGHSGLAMVRHYSHDLYFESAAMILGLITLGKYLEARSKGRTSDAIAKLMDLAPKVATVVRGDQEVEIPVGELVEGDIVVIKPGQSIPVDGVIRRRMSQLSRARVSPWPRVPVTR